MKMLSNKELERMEKTCFKAGVVYAIRRLLEEKAIVHDKEVGYASCVKYIIDPGKAIEIERLAFELIHGRKPIDGELGEEAA